MRPKLSMLEEIAQTFYRAGQIPPQNITKGLEEGYRLEAVSYTHLDVYKRQGFLRFPRRPRSKGGNNR